MRVFADGGSADAIGRPGLLERAPSRYRRRGLPVLPWHRLVEIDPEQAANGRESLAGTLINLRSLGYRSVPRADQSQPAGIRQDAT